MFYGNYEGPDLKGSSNYNDAQMAPAILGDVTEKMAIWQEELFGPVVSYVLVQNEDEAVQVANKTGYGLAAAVFTRDLRRGFALAKRLESG
jgi:acyl-CoA reductase-like NAD-dependent aldehyde dehydrogenase